MGNNIKKTIKIGFEGFDGSINPTDNIFIDILKKYYHVVLSETPDYIFCSMYYGWDKYKRGVINRVVDFPQVRIFIDGENFVPDYNIYDYSISSFDISFGDRNFYLPCGLQALYQTDFKHFLSLPKGERSFTMEDLLSKEYFATFSVSHESEYRIREEFYKQLSKYKRVESAGPLLRNNPFIIRWHDESKCHFQEKGKFSLCFESTKHDHFITEKIVDAFYSNSVPVYFGSEYVKDIFNPKAFIYCENVNCFDDTIKKIIEIDQDEKRYIDMMREPIFLDEKYPEQIMENLERWIVHIFEQPLDKAYRRSRCFLPQFYENFFKISEPYMLKKGFKACDRKNMLKNWPKFVLRKICGNERYEIVKNKLMDKRDNLSKL